MRVKFLKSYEFDFVDVLFYCVLVLGIKVLFDFSYYIWWLKVIINGIKGVYKWLIDYIEENGFYDVVICFF